MYLDPMSPLPDPLPDQFVPRRANVPHRQWRMTSNEAYDISGYNSDSRLTDKTQLYAGESCDSEDERQQVIHEAGSLYWSD